MANTQNLRPFTSDQSREEAAKNGRKGGKKSGESRRRKRSMRENLQMLMELQIVNPDMIKTMKEFGVPDDEMTYQSAVNIARLNAALSMNIKAIDSVDELLSEGIKAEQLKEQKRANKANEKLRSEEIKGMHGNTTEKDNRKFCDVVEQMQAHKNDLEEYENGSKTV